MIVFWYAVVSLMLAVYVVLDGFDFGAGILHLFVARTDRERREVLAAIGPVWDGNEVWLLASGGVLVFAFPRAYAVGFSGFYLPLMMVLWLLVMRGLSIELRSHLDNPLWRTFWDSLLALASVLMAVVLGAALGNVLRGVSLDETGFFETPWFTNFRTGPHTGVLDWYTLLIGAFAVVVLAGHGALYLAGKTSEVVHGRSLSLARTIWPLVPVLGALCVAASAVVRPVLYDNLAARPWIWLFVAAAVGAVAGVFRSLRRKRERTAFFCSAAFLASTLAATAAAFFPLLLPSTIDPRFSLTAPQAAAGEHGLRVGLVWWAVGIPLAVAYTVFGFRIARGRVTVEDESAPRAPDAPSTRAP